MYAGRDTPILQVVEVLREWGGEVVGSVRGSRGECLGKAWEMPRDIAKSEDC